MSNLIEAEGGGWDREFLERKLGKGITFEVSIKKISNKRKEKSYPILSYQLSTYTYTYE